MKRPLLYLVPALAVVLHAGPCLAGKYNKVVSVGDRAPTFSGIPAISSGQNTTLDLGNIKEDIVVLAFMNEHAPFAFSLDQRLSELIKRYKGQNVGFVRFNVGRTKEGRMLGIKEWTRSKGGNFVYAFDEGRNVAKLYGVTVTPQFVVLDKARGIRYLGALDDIKPGQDKPSHTFVEDSVLALLKGQATASGRDETCWRGSR